MRRVFGPQQYLSFAVGLSRIARRSAGVAVIASLDNQAAWAPPQVCRQTFLERSMNVPILNFCVSEARGA